MEKLKVYEALARAFVEEGVETVFGLMGDGNMLWSVAMAESEGVTLIHARHENAAVAMADGYSQASGRVGVCTVTCGPGITQIPSSLTSSVRHGTPMVILAGDTPRGSAFHLQEFNPGPLIESTGARHITLRNADSAGEDVQRAFYIARTERIPVVLTAPYDIQEQDYPWDWAYQPSTELVPKPQRIHPDPAGVDRLATLLAEAQRPVILAGRGAVAAGARATLVELGERTGALLATSLLGKGLFEGEAYDVGLAGAFATPTARELLATADVVVAFGAGLGHFTTEGGYLFEAATVVQVDVSPTGMKEGVPVADLHLTGDAGLVAHELLHRLEQRDHRNVGMRTEEIRSRLADSAFREPPIELQEGTIDPRAALAAINAALPSDWIIVIGAGHFWNFAVQYTTGRSPESYIYTATDFGVVGQGLGAAIGAALALPDRRVALIEGDGSLLMNIQELETMVRHGIDVVTLVINDGAFGAEIHKLEAMGLDGSEAVFGAPDLAAIAQAFGITSARVDATQPDAEAAVADAVAGTGPQLVDFHVSPTVRSAQYRRVFFGEAV